MLNMTQETFDEELKIEELTDVSGGLSLKFVRPQQKLQRRVRPQRQVLRPFGKRPMDRPMCW